MTKITEYVNKEGTITVDYMKKHVPSRDTNNIYCHPYYEIIIIVSGKVTYTANEGVTRIGERSVVFIEPYTVHNPFVHDVQIYERYRIRFYPDFASGLLSDKYSEELISLLSGSYMKELEDSDFEVLYGLIRGVFERLSSDKNEKTSDLVNAADIITLLNRARNAPRRTQLREANYINDVLEYIKESYKDRLTINEIASRFFVSRGKLIYDFKAVCNMSVTEYITVTRIEAAKRSLLLGYSVSATALSCGFSSSGYFIKVFSSITGITPLKFQLKFSRQ